MPPPGPRAPEPSAHPHTHFAVASGAHVVLRYVVVPEGQPQRGEAAVHGGDDVVVGTC